jgi:hypothetical protein
MGSEGMLRTLERALHAPPELSLPSVVRGGTPVNIIVPEGPHHTCVVLRQWTPGLP